jgi:hypothetical protein
MFAHGVGVPSYSTEGARGFGVVVLTKRSGGMFDWTDINDMPRDPVPEYDLDGADL